MATLLTATSAGMAANRAAERGEIEVRRLRVWAEGRAVMNILGCEVFLTEQNHR
jgi:hypothetical protein